MYQMIIPKNPTGFKMETPDNPENKRLASNVRKSLCKMSTLNSDHEFPHDHTFFVNPFATRTVVDDNSITLTFQAQQISVNI